MADIAINQAPSAPFPLQPNTYIAFDVVDPSSPTGYKFSKGTVADFINQIGVVSYEILNNLDGTYSLVNASNPAITYGNIIILPTLTNLGGGTYEYNRFDGNPIQFTTGGGGGGGTSFVTEEVNANKTITDADNGKMLIINTNGVVLTVGTISTNTVIGIDCKSTGVTLAATGATGDVDGFTSPYNIPLNGSVLIFKSLNFLRIKGDVA